MNVISPLPHKKARIEIIPLIDIMFFLLAVMMMVNLGMVKMQGINLNLPTAATATDENRSDFLTLSVKQDGSLYLDKEPVSRPQLTEKLKDLKAKQPELRVYIQGDTDASHGDVIAVLDRVRSAGIQKVAFQIKPDTQQGGIIDKQGIPASAPVEQAQPSTAATTTGEPHS